MFFLLLCFLSIWYVFVRCLCLHLSFTEPQYIHLCCGCCCCRFPIAPNNNDIVTGYPQHERYSLLRQPIRDTRFHIEMRICLFDHLHPHEVATVPYKWPTYLSLSYCVLPIHATMWALFSGDAINKTGAYWPLCLATRNVGWRAHQNGSQFSGHQSTEWRQERQRTQLNCLPFRPAIGIFIFPPAVTDKWLRISDSL